MQETWLTWLATNMLCGNFDTISHNFFVYSPSDPEAPWFILPWDFDGAWGYVRRGRGV